MPPPPLRFLEPDSTVQSLEVLLDLERKIAEGAHDDRVARLDVPEARAVLEDIIRCASADAQLIDEALEALRADARAAEASAREPEEVSSRELLEAWISLKETSCDVLSVAATQVRSRALARRLNILAREEAERAAMLRALDV